MLPIGGGIPLGVLMARDAGLSAIATAGLYLLSDVLLAFVTEPFIKGMTWLGQRVAFLGRVGQVFARFTGTTGLRDGGVRGPVGLVLVSFSVSPTTGRAAAAAAGHGFVSGWSLAIIGDMAYFALLMATTLWVSSIFGDDRLTIGAVLLGTWLLPLALRRLRGGSRPRERARDDPTTPVPTPTFALGGLSAGPTRALPRKRPIAARRRTRGLHR
jgi:hypothetical protein